MAAVAIAWPKVEANYMPDQDSGIRSHACHHASLFRLQFISDSHWMVQIQT